MIDFRTLLLAFLFIGIFGVAYLTPAYSQEIEKGKNFDRQYIGTGENGLPKYIWSSHPERIITTYEWSGRPVWSEYRLTETADNVFLETANSGSLNFDKNTCSYNLHKNGYIDMNNAPQIKNISWTVKGKANTTSSWSNIPAINNAACSVTVQTTEQTVRIIGQKSVGGTGTFQIVLDYSPGSGIKETMRGYNDNPAWTNHNIGFVETFEVPQIIHFGNNEYDLSQYNGTTLNRTWIQNNANKMIKLSNNISYDFGIGFSNLDKVEIIWTGTKAKLALHYLFDNDIVPYQSWFEVDPTFTSNNPTVDGHVLTNTTVSTACDSTANSKVTGSTIIEGSNIPTSGVSSSCYYGFAEWDISTLDSDFVINSANYTFEITSVTNPRNCALIGMTARPSTATDQQILNSISERTIGDDPVVSASATCTTTGTQKTIQLGANGSSYITSQLASGWAALGMRFQDMTRDGSVHDVAYASEENASPEPAPTLTLEYTDPTPAADAVDDLTAMVVTTVSVQLDWTEPALNGGTLLGYQINKSDGGGDPSTIVTNNTGSSDTAYLVSGLSSAVNSFRVGIWTNNGLNASGNIATTEGVSFEIGNINVTATNTEQTGIQFELDPINDTADWLNVTYADTYDLACNFGYMFARTNNTYTNLDNTTINDSFVESSFLILDHENEIINVRCWDQNSNDTGFYVLTQNAFPLLDQIQNFRNGTYGTAGDFGLLDFITLIVVIISMIGFNRVDETVGALFNVFFLGALWYFEIIEPISLLFGFLAVALMLVITKNRGD